MKILVSCSCSSSLILLKLFSPLIHTNSTSTVMKYWHSRRRRRRSAPSVCHYIVVLHRQWFISWISQTPSFSSLRVQPQSRGDDHNRRFNFSDWLSAVSPRRKFHGRTAKRLKGKRYRETEPTFVIFCLWVFLFSSSFFCCCCFFFTLSAT